MHLWVSICLLVILSPVLSLLSVSGSVLVSELNSWVFICCSLKARRGHVTPPCNENKFLVGIYQTSKNKISTKLNCSDVPSPIQSKKGNENLNSSFKLMAWE